MKTTKEQNRQKWGWVFIVLICISAIIYFLFSELNPGPKLISICMSLVVTVLFLIPLIKKS